MAAPRSSIEREVKLGAWAGFTLPDLNGVAEGITAVERPERALRAVYHDTADLRLARWGVTLRHRTGQGSGWTVKLPEGEEGPALVRREVNRDGAPGKVPPAANDLVRAYVRNAPLVAVAQMRTRRRAVELLDAEGQAVAEVVDDEVSVLHGGRVAARFREVEVEVTDRAGSEVLDAVIARLREVGAGQPDPTPKLVRALGARALGPPELAPVPLDDSASMADVVRAAIVNSTTRILRHDPGIRIGDDPEDVHQARVGTRRLRSDLRTFAPVLVEEWLQPLRDELRWLAGALGAVRDADVLAERLRRQADALPARDASGLAPLFRKLAAERERAGEGLIAALSGARYVALLDRLVIAAQPQSHSGIHDASVEMFRPEAGQAAVELLPELVSRPWRHVKKAVGELDANSPPEALHEVRIRVKRARYAAEAAAPVIGKKARGFGKALADAQGVLGDYQDAMVAEKWLRGAIVRAGAVQAMAAGELIAVQRAEAVACREEWPAAWRQLDRKKLRSWLA
ncbi:MAG TPA: CYTH and CHAD domain-containing protein [Acidimicrobiales bacterium]|nr:CYTH and CHAD domain-containing protein [Acidimicrobiales bacterium]